MAEDVSLGSLCLDFYQMLATMTMLMKVERLPMIMMVEISGDLEVEMEEVPPTIDCWQV